MLPAQEEKIHRLVAEGKDFSREEIVSAEWNAELEYSQEDTIPEAQAALIETVSYTLFEGNLGNLGNLMNDNHID